MAYNNLDEEHPKIKQPKNLKIKLKDHQLTTIWAMNELENQSCIIVDKPEMCSGLYQTVKLKLNDIQEFLESSFIIQTNSAILADKVGSGKTYDIIGLILYNQIPKSHERLIIGTDHFSIKMISAKESIHINLIVVPHNLVNQWDCFMKKSDLKYLKLNSISDFNIFFDIEYVVDKTNIENNQLVIFRKTKKRKLIKGSKANKNAIYEKYSLNQKKINRVIKKHQIIILNINRYRFFKQIFKSIKWARVIIDEMDSANIPLIFDEFGNFNWFLTATPTSIFHRSCKRYVNKIFGYNQHLLQYFIVKNKDEYVDNSMILPKPYVYMINTLLQKIVSAICDLIPQDVLQLINSGNMKEAIIKLNCDIDTEENIFKVLTNKINIELHNLQQDLQHAENIIPIDKELHDKKISKIKENIASCKTRLETIDKRLKSIKKECCLICAGPYDTPAILDCCKNIFCLKCLLTSLKIANNKCPYCRQIVQSNKQYHIISKESKVKIKENKKKIKKGFSEMDKLDVLDHILDYIAKYNEKPRILIFSDYTQTFDKIIKNIAKVKLHYALLSGTPGHISNVINDYNNGDLNILFMNSQCYGSGLNLQETEYLILYHRMTLELETQVIGRAQRYGRKKSLRIIYLVNDNENNCTKLTSNPINIKSKNDLYLLSDPTEQSEHETSHSDTMSENEQSE